MFRKTFGGIMATVVFCVASGGVTCFLDSRATAEPNLSQSYAILIGVNHYTPPFQNLEFCHNDMEQLQDKLIAAGFPEENIVFMRDGATEARFWPSKANIENQLTLRLGLANEEDLVLVAFSGHGLHVDGVSYVCPSDAKVAQPGQTMVSLDGVYRQLEACKARQKVLLVDACRNEPLLKGIKAATGLKGFAADLTQPPKGLRVLASCEAGQWSAEDPELKRGVFMHYVTTGLDGHADREYAGNKNGKVSLFELYTYAHEKTKKHVAKSHGILQRPVLRGEFVGEYEIASVPAEIRPLAETAVVPSAPLNGLLAQGEMYFTRGELAKAIDTYTKAIRVEQDTAVLRSAYLKRSAAYVARDGEGDLEQALTDRLAAGQTTLPLAVIAETAELKAGTEVSAVVNRGQVVSVTKITPFKGTTWLYVASVDGDATARGYISQTAVTRSNSSTAEPTTTRSSSHGSSSAVRGTVASRVPSIRMSDLKPGEQGHLKSLAGVLVRRAEDYERKQARAAGKGALAQGAADAAKRSALTAESNLQLAIDKIEARYGGRFVDFRSLLP